MTVRLEAHAIVLEGRCGVDEAEALLTLLESHPALPVDIAAAEAVHTALWQVVLMAKPKICGATDGNFVADHLLPALDIDYQ